MPAIQVSGLRKSYGEICAVDDVSLSIAEGEIVAILGPNGAGKTTLIEILEGFRKRDAGEVTVLGQDPERPDRRFYDRMGVVLQECEAEAHVSVSELVELYRGYYSRPRPLDDLLNLVGLRDSAHARIRTLSGGQRRRLDLALALVGHPVLVFMDEPTTGFDPEARRIAWETIRDLRRAGTTILLTTHYLEEAEALADRVIVIAGGKIVAEGAPALLGARDRALTTISFRPLASGLAPALPVPVRVSDSTWSVETPEPTRTLALLATWALDRGLELEDLRVGRPSLEDVYLELIG